jgi:hypothetical protein
MLNKNVFDFLIEMINELRNVFERRVISSEVVFRSPVGEVRRDNKESVILIKERLKDINIFLFSREIKVANINGNELDISLMTESIG